MQYRSVSTLTAQNFSPTGQHHTKSCVCVGVGGRGQGAASHDAVDHLSTNKCVTWVHDYNRELGVCQQMNCHFCVCVWGEGGNDGSAAAAVPCKWPFHHQHRRHLGMDCKEVC